MNEVSNGISGSGNSTQEYVEFVVVSNSVVYNCNSPTPPCIDIRGWIFDDNSGYHGPAGVAAGAVRFSNDALWSCVPLGTIIVIYNGLDRNPAIPPDDLSLTDGNCTIIAPIDNVTLFDQNPTTPGAIACSYPSTGWVAGGLWANTALANPSDCARIVDLGGCEVFSVCYGAADNLNTLIYFAPVGTNTVYYFNGLNPTLQANWSAASASTSQTPGAPNNTTNAAYIAQFNNGCLPITPINVTATFTNAGCTCTGTATATATGSISGYTYAWFDAAFVAIGQSTATATGLCAGVYNVIATSSIGCADTASVTIIGAGASTVTVNSPTICTGDTAVLTAAGATSYTWSAGATVTGATTASVTPAVTTSYTVTGTTGGCSSTAIATVTVASVLNVAVNSPSICAGTSATLTATGAATYTWSPGATSTGITTATASPLATATYTVTGTTAGCSATAVATVTVNPTPLVTINSPTICAGATATLNAAGATSYTWSVGATSSGTTTANASPLATTTYTVTGTTAVCSSTAVSTVTINVGLTLVAGTNGSICPGDSIVLTALATFGNGGPYTYSWSPAVGVLGNVSPALTTTYTVSANDGCSPTATAIVTITVLPAPTVVMNANTLSGCAPICVNFTDASTVLGGGTINSWEWNLGDGVLNTTQNPIHCYVNAGSYSVSLTVTASNGCTGNAIQNNYINVYPVPEAEFTSNTAVTDILNSQICFSNQSIDASIYQWSFGDMASSTETNPVHTYNTTGQYSVLLIAANSQGCVDSAMYSIDITGIFTFYAPNAFTPNDDLTNNIFLPKGIGWNLDKYKLMIFDRWGNMCFETLDASKGWDGKANNGSEFAQQDVYVWKVELTDLFNSAHHYIGSVTIIK